MCNRRVTDPGGRNPVVTAPVTGQTALMERIWLTCNRNRHTRKGR